MTTVLGDQGADERRLPDGHEAVLLVESKETGEQGVDAHQAVFTEGQVVGVELAAVMHRAWDPQGIVVARFVWIARGQARLVGQQHDPVLERQRHLVLFDRHTHRGVEGPRQMLQALAIGTDENHLAGLVGGDGEGNAEFG